MKQIQFLMINPFMPNEFSHLYQLDEFIYNFRVVGWYFLKFLFNLFYVYSGEPDQMLCYAAFDLGLPCVPMSHKKDDRLIWVKHHISKYSLILLLSADA